MAEQQVRVELDGQEFTCAVSTFTNVFEERGAVLAEGEEIAEPEVPAVDTDSPAVADQSEAEASSFNPEEG